jgi:prepilin-type N-terminal cleavage/methylation domain-containing protein
MIKRNFRAGRRSQGGVTLVELMIALAAGVVVSAAAVAFLMATFRSNADYVQSTRLTQELRNTLDLATRDLQRAGYDDNALTYVGNSNVSPFAPLCIASMAAPTCVTDTTAGSCVLYGYDRTYPNGTTTPSGTAGTVDVGNGEVRGLRLNSVTVNGRTVGVLEYAVSSGSTRPACDGASADYTTFPATCNSTSLWCPLSDGSKLDITALTIANNGSSTSSGGIAMGVRRLDIGMTGRIAGSTDFTRNVRASVKVRADCMRAAIGSCSARP